MDAEIQAQIEAIVHELVKLRKDRGLNQRHVAEMMGIGQQAVSTIELCKHPIRLSTLQRYARAVGAELRFEVVTEEDEEYVDPGNEDLFLEMEAEEEERYRRDKK